MAVRRESECPTETEVGTRFDLSNPHKPSHALYHVLAFRVLFLYCLSSLGGQALWLVLAMDWLVRPDNVLDLAKVNIASFSIQLHLLLAQPTLIFFLVL